MSNNLTKVLLLAASLMCSSVAFSQSECLTTLSDAEAEFNAGRFFGIPEKVKDCIDRNAFSRDEQVRVYMLLTQVYLLTDNPQAAENSYLKLLEANPEYIADEKLDPIDVVYLSKKFTTTPIFTPHFKGGANLTGQYVLHDVNTLSKPSSVTEKRKMLAGWHLGGGVEWNINDNFGLGSEFLVSFKSFRTTYSSVFDRDFLVSTEKQLWLDIPLYLRYHVNTGKVRPFVYAGGAVNLLVRTRLQESFNDLIEDGTGTEKVSTSEGPDRNIQYRRNFFNRSLVFGGGIKYKIGKDYILVDLRYMPGLSNVTNINYNSYSSTSQDQLDPGISQYSSLGSIFRVNNLSFSVGYVYPLYDARKVKRVRTKSVSKKISKDSEFR